MSTPWCSDAHTSDVSCWSVWFVSMDSNDETMIGVEGETGIECVVLCSKSTGKGMASSFPDLLSFLDAMGGQSWQRVLGSRLGKCAGDCRGRVPRIFHYCNSCKCYSHAAAS